MGSIPELILDPQTQYIFVDDPSPTLSVQWDQTVQKAVIKTSPGPTIAARAYGMLHTAIYDAWAAYDPTATATQMGDQLQRPLAENTETNKAEAMSFAAYRVLVDLFPTQVDLFNTLMAELGYDPANTTIDTSTPAGIGNVAASALLAFRHGDGSNQLGDNPAGNGNPYSDISGYTPVNPVADPVEIDRWTPERVPIDAVPGEERAIQRFLTPHWGNVIPFASTDEALIDRPPPPQPFLMVDGEVNLDARTITLSDGTELPISRELVGTVINPAFIDQAEQLVEVSANLTDEQKLIAEFWEDAGGTGFPPGSWMTIGEFTSARDDNSLDEDAQLFFALGNAVADAGIATWDTKVFYDYVRPVRAIRELGELGLIGTFDPGLGGYSIEAWGGPNQGTQTILATDFLTYQTPGGNPSPPFAEYTSGHSAFSAAGAEILKLFTGSDDFGGSVTFQPGQSRFEPGVTPQNPVTLAWGTFSEAAEEAGLSRIYGGIHFEEGNLNGRILGQQVGQLVWQTAQSWIDPPTRLGDTLGGSERPDLLVGATGNDQLLGLAGEDTLQGERGNDLLQGQEDGDELLGGQGLDTLLGGLDRDTLFGGKYNDVLLGEAGEDILKGDRGNDTLTGGEGRDRFDVRPQDGSDVIVDFEVGVDAIGLLGGLRFDQLAIVPEGTGALITAEGLFLRLQEVSPDRLSPENFLVL